MEPEASPPRSCPLSQSAESLQMDRKDSGFSLVTCSVLTSVTKNHVGLLTFVAEVIPTSSSITGRALGTRTAMLVRSLADPVAPAEVNSGQLD